MVAWEGPQVLLAKVKNASGRIGICFSILSPQDLKWNNPELKCISLITDHEQPSDKAACYGRVCTRDQSAVSGGRGFKSKFSNSF